MTFGRGQATTRVSPLKRDEMEISYKGIKCFKEYKEVDISETEIRISPYYNGVQKLIVYHGTDALKKYENNYTLCTNALEFHTYLEGIRRSKNVTPINMVYNFITSPGINIWMPTGETLVPERTFKSKATTYLLMDDKPVMVDNCYIKVFVAVNFRQEYKIYTSAGIFTISLKKTELTCAIPYDFTIPVNNPVDKRVNTTKEEKIKMISNSTKTTTIDMQFVMYFLHPTSPAFMDADKAYKMATPAWMPPSCKNAYINSKKINNLLLKYTRFLMPNFKEELNEVIGGAAQIAKWYKTLAEDTLASKTETAKNKLEIIDAVASLIFKDDVADARLSEQAVTGYLPRFSNAAPQHNMLAGNNVTSREVVLPDGITLFEDSSLVGLDAEDKAKLAKLEAEADAAEIANKEAEDTLGEYANSFMDNEL